MVEKQNNKEEASSVQIICKKLDRINQKDRDFKYTFRDRQKKRHSNFKCY